MKRRWWMLVLVLLLPVAVYVPAQKLVRAGQQQKLQRQVEVLRSEAAALAKDGRFAQAADKFEELQVFCMNAGRYQDALEASLAIEDLSAKVSERRSPWNYVRVAEAYLGMDDAEKYFDWMERAVGERRFSKLDYFQAAQLDRVRGHPRFKNLVASCAAIVGVGQEAKDFQVALLDGSAFTLSAYRGKVVLIDFWDVRCGPCRKEMPNLKEIYKDFRDKGLEIVGISLDTEKTLLDDYLKGAALPWKIACSWDGWNDRTAKLYQISATPSTWLIDRRGVVRYYDVRGDELRRAVEALVRESS